MSGNRISLQIRMTFIGTSNIQTVAIPTSGRMAKFNMAQIDFETRGHSLSAITETEPGAEIVCILEFSAQPRDPDGHPVPGPRREFHVGDRVRYLSSYYKNSPEDNPTGHMAVFGPLDHEDQKHYAATQNYFVTVDCWEGLKRHFARVRTKLDGRDMKDRGAPSQRTSARRSVP